MPGNSYQKISQKDKERLREPYNRGEDFVHLAKLLSILMNRITANSIVLRDQDAPAHDEKRYQKLSEITSYQKDIKNNDMRDYLCDCPSVTLC